MELRQICGSRKWDCPVEDCAETFKGDNFLVFHFGVGHGLVIGHYLQTIAGSPAGNALVAYREALGIEPLACDVKISREHSCG